MEAQLSEPFFTRKMKMLCRPDGFMLYGKLEVDFFTICRSLYPNWKDRWRLIRARHNFHMISDNPHVSLGIVDFHFTLVFWFSRMIITRKEWTCLRILPSGTTTLRLCQKPFILPAGQTQFIREKKLPLLQLSKCHCNEYKLFIHWIV